MNTPPAATITTMDAVQDAIVEQLKESFGLRVRQIGLYDAEDWIGEAETQLQTPALLLQVDGLDYAESIEADALERMSFTCSFAIHCVLSAQTTNVQAVLPQYAAAVGALVLAYRQTEWKRRGNSWGLGMAVDPPVFISAQPAGFAPGLHGFDSWVVRWEQTIFLSDSLPDA